MRILVLGATGNVGGAVVEAALAGGHEVRAVSRGGSDLPKDAERYVGDLDDASTLKRAPSAVRPGKSARFVPGAAVVRGVWSRCAAREGR